MEKIIVNNVDITKFVTSFEMYEEMDTDTIIGSTISTQVKLKLNNKDGQLTELLDYPFFIGNKTYIIYEKPSRWTQSISLVLYDQMILTNIPYETELPEKTTIEAQLEEMSQLVGIEIDKSTLSQDVLNRQVDWQDKTMVIRTYLGYIAQCDGKNAYVENDKIVFRVLCEDTHNIDFCSNYEINELIIITRVYYNNGTVIYSRGNKSNNTLYLNSNNRYVNESDVERIFSLYDHLSFYSFRNFKCRKTQDIKLTNLITYNGMTFMPISIKRKINGGEAKDSLELSGDIQIKNAEDVTISTNPNEEIKKIIIDQIDATRGEFERIDTEFIKVNQQLEANRADINILNASVAKIEEAYISKAQVEQLYATKAEVGTILANVAEIQEAMIGVAYVDDLNALEAKINEIEAGSITTDYLETNYAKIDLSNIENGCITTAMIQTGAIGTAQIADGSITDAKIVGLTANKITAGTIDASDIEVINLNCANLTVGTINGQQIANNAIDWDKLSSQVSGSITEAGDNANQALEDALEAFQKAQEALNSANSAQTTANGKNTVFYQSAQPAVSGRKVNDIWYDTDDGYKMYYFNGTSWQAVEFGENAIADDAISADKIASDVNSKINDAFTNAGIAISDSSNALSKANTAINDASTAKSNASTALSTANSAKSTADSALDSINNLEIGGRNYFKRINNNGKSGTYMIDFDGNYECVLPDYNETGSFGQFYNLTVPMSYFLGKKVKLTFDCISPNGPTSIQVYNRNGTPRYPISVVGLPNQIDTEWVHLELDLKISDAGEGLDETASNKIEIYLPGKTGGIVRKVKLEIGTKATDWTPAPEDVDNAIELVQTTADGKNTVFYQTSAPSTSNRKVNDVWFDTDDSNKMYYWNGSAWTARQFGTNAIANLAITNALIANGTIQNAKIANLDAAKITSGYINVARLQAGSITADKLKADTITAASGVIADAAILTANIADLAVSSGKIANAAIGTAKIADLAVTNAKLANLSVTNAKIADATIQSAKIASLDAGKITSGYISSDRIQAGSLAIGKLDSSTQNTINTALTTAQNATKPTIYLNGNYKTMTYYEIGKGVYPYIEGSASGTVRIYGTIGGWTNSTMGAIDITLPLRESITNIVVQQKDRTINSATCDLWVVKDSSNVPHYYLVLEGYASAMLNIVYSTNYFTLTKASSTTAPSGTVVWKLSDKQSVTDDLSDDISTIDGYIADWCYNNNRTYINGGKIYTGTVAAAQIAANAITSDKISANAVIAGKIAANAVTTGTIAADAVTSAKIAADAINAEHVAANAITTDNIVAGAVTGAKIAASTITANNIAANTITAAKIASGTITATQIASGTITATQLASNSVTAVKIAANAITSDKISANAITSAKIATDAIKSRNYVANSTGSYLNLQDGSFSSKNLKWTRDGTLTATNANFTGKITGSTISGGAISGTTITATSGKIGGWNLSSNELTSEYGNSKILLHSHSSAEKGYIGIVGEDDETKRLYNVTLVCNDIDAAVTIKSEGSGDVRISPYKIEIFNNDYQITNSTHAMVLKAYQYLHLYSNVNVTAKVGEYTNVLCGTNGDMSVSSSIYMNSNNKYIYGKTTTGVSLRNIIPCNSGNNCMIGYGGYENKMAETNIYGNAVKLTTMTTISGNKAYTNTSDIRFKKNINPIDDVFYKIWEQLTPVEFEWNEKNNPDGKINFGLTAQSVIEAISDYGLDYKKYAIINTFTKENDTTEYYSVAYDYYHMLTAKALKKTINRVDTHDRDLQVLRNENAQLRQELKNTQDKLDAFINNNFQVREVTA